MALLCLNFSSIAQGIPDSIQSLDSVNIAYQNRLADIFANVDLTEVPSGILYEHGFPFISLDAFNGQITDSSKANNMIFGLAYASLSSMTVDSTIALPAPEDYRSISDTVTPLSNVIPIVGLHQIYHQIDSTSLEDSLFTMVDSNLVDVIGRPRSPYIEKELFLF